MNKIKFEEIFAKKLKYTIGKRFSGNAFADLTLHQRFEEIIDAMLFELSTKVLSEEVFSGKVKIPITYKRPKNWWQMFKMAYFPKFLLKQFPVKYGFTFYEAEIDLSIYATMPKIAKVFPAETIIFKYMVGFQNEKT